MRHGGSAASTTPQRRQGSGRSSSRARRSWCGACHNDTSLLHATYYRTVRCMTQRPELVSLRPMAPTDLAGVTLFLEQLSKESLYQRFFSRSRSGLLYELNCLRSLDGDQQVALVAEADHQIIGLARYQRTGYGHAEVAVVVADAWQRHGLGGRLLRDLAQPARRHGVEALDVSMLGAHLAALHLLRGLAWRRPLHLDHGVFDP